MSITHTLPYEWQVGLRYTRAGKRSSRNSFISFISLASVAGIALPRCAVDAAGRRRDETGAAARGRSGSRE
jgi:hypothetical protein